MKKTGIKILILLCVFLLLGGVAVLLMRNPASTEDDNTSSELLLESSALPDLLSREADEVATVTVKNEEATFTLLPLTPEDTTEESEGAAKIFFTVEGLTEEDLLTDEAAAFARTLYQMTPTKELGTQESLADFGLAGDGQAKVDITYTDGTSDTVVIGDTPGASAGRYVLKDGLVYIVPGISEKVFGSPTVFYDTTVIAVADRMEKDTEGNEVAVADQLEALTLSGVNYPQPITIQLAQAGSMTDYTMVAPMTADGNTTKIEEVIVALKSLSATGIASASYETADLAQYGLDDPAAIAEYVLNGEHHMVSVSAPDETGRCYLIADDKGKVYEVATTSVSAWTDAKVMDLRSSYIFLPNITNVKKLTMTADGHTAAFSITRTIDEEKTTEDALSYNLAITLDGKEVSYDDAYQPMYRKLIGTAVLSADEVVFDRTQPVLQVTYAYFESGETDELTFYEIPGQDRYAVEKNGAYGGIVKRVSIEEILADLEAITGS